MESSEYQRPCLDQKIVAAIALCLVLPVLQAETFSGACDGSAVVSLGDGFFLSATDDDNQIRLYRLGAPGGPARTWDWNPYLRPEARKKRLGFKESDIEAAAKTGDRVYWIGSHGPDSDGKRERSRERFFATQVTGTGASTDLKPAGQPYTQLVEHLVKLPDQPGKALKDAAADHTLEIEGLAATDRKSVVIGFRSPLVNGKALLVELTNPAAVVEQGAPPAFARPMLVSLGGLAVRALEYDPQQKNYLLIAGPQDDKGEFQLYRWHLGDEKASLVKSSLSVKAGSAEGLMMASGRVWIAFDGGRSGNPPCKDLPPDKQSFTIERLQ